MLKRDASNDFVDFFIESAYCLSMSKDESWFKAWMDERGLSAREVGARLHVEDQTIRQWRTYGVPKRRLPHVENMIATWDDAAPDLAEIRAQTLVIRTDAAQFRRWESAARRAGEDHIEDWARNSLETMAAQDALPPLQMAAEEATTYKAHPASEKTAPAAGTPTAAISPPPKKKPA